MLADRGPCTLACAPAATCRADLERAAASDPGLAVRARAFQCLKYDKCGTLVTAGPTTSPSRAPTASPSEAPTARPTHSPSRAPSRSPTHSPSRAPTASPSAAPSAAPSASPTIAPTKRQATCQELLGGDGGGGGGGATTAPGGAFPGVCGVTAVRDCGPPQEQGSGAWAVARARCAAIGARLCTLDELRGGCASGTGTCNRTQDTGSRIRIAVLCHVDSIANPCRSLF